MGVFTSESFPGFFFVIVIYDFFFVMAADRLLIICLYYSGDMHHSLSFNSEDNVHISGPRPTWKTKSCTKMYKRKDKV